MRNAILKGVLSGWLAMCVAAVVSIALTPILIRELGALYYGMWVLVASLVDYYGLLDVGLQATLQRFVARLNGVDDRRALDEVLATALAAGTSVALVAAAVSVALAGAAADFFARSPAERQVLSGLVMFLGGSVAVGLPTRILGAYLCGLQRFDLYNFAAMVLIVARGGLFVSLLHSGKGVLAISLGNLVLAAASLAVHWILVRYADPEVRLGWGRVRGARARELFEFGSYVFVARLGDQLRFHADSLVIGRILGIASVTPFSIAARLMDYFKSVVYSVMGPLTPAMSELEGQGRGGDLRSLFLNSTRATALLSLFIASMLLLNGRAVLRVWVGEEFMVVYPLVVILTVPYLVALAQCPSVSMFYAAARHRALAWWTVGEGVANLVLSVYWGRLYGLWGVALGTAVPMLLVKTLVQPRYALAITSIAARDYLREGLARPLAVWVIFAALVSGVPELTEPGFGELLFRVLWEALVFALLVYALGMKPSERAWLRLAGRRAAATLRVALVE